ncbi:MAG TPA: cyanophycin synthetase, partial [Steroidobacteraceae bacterium]
SRDMPRVLEEIALENGAPLKRPGIEYRYALDDGTWQFHGSRWNLLRLPPPALAGDAQYANAAAAIAALEELVARFTIPPAAVARGLSEVKLAARFQVILPAAPDVPTWILDVAHNPAAARVLAGNLRGHSSGGRTLAVCGILADKDAAGVVAELRDSVDAWWCVPIEGERGRSAAALAQTVAQVVAAPVEAAPSIAAACAAAAAHAGPKDRIVVFGSFHVVGPTMDWLEANALLPPVAA